MDEQFQQLGFQSESPSAPAPQVGPGAPATPAPDPFAALGFQAGSGQPPAYNPTSPANILDDVVHGTEQGVGNFASQAFEALKQQAGTAWDNLQGDVTDGANALETSNGSVGGDAEAAATLVGRAGIGTVSDLANLVLSPVTAVLGTSINNIADLASDVPAVQDVADSAPVSGGLNVINNAKQAVADWAEQNPQAYKQLSDIVNVAGVAAGGEAAPGDIAATGDDMAAAKEGIQNTAQGVSDAVSSLVPSPAADTPAAHQASLATDWTAPTEEMNNSYNGARKVLAQSPEAPSTLAQMGINPAAYIEDGKYDTSELAQEIRDAATSESNQQLRPALQLADTYTAPSQVSAIQQSAIDMVNADTTLTPGTKLRVSNNIKNELSALNEQNPDGLTLTAAHDNKITYSQNAGYSPINDPSANNIATANRYISRALAQDVETRAPASLPVHEVNQDLSKAYSAADYVAALQNKKVPVTFKQSVARGIAKFGGATIARHLPFVGGDIISDFAGYQIGKYLEGMLENMSHPGRAQYLSNLEKYEPQSYQALQSFIKINEDGNPQLLRLPPGSAGTSSLNNGNAIPALPGSGTYTGSQTVAQSTP
jgi:hypothetical protein